MLVSDLLDNLDSMNVDDINVNMMTLLTDSEALIKAKYLTTMLSVTVDPENAGKEDEAFRKTIREFIADLLKSSSDISMNTVIKIKEHKPTKIDSEFADGIKTLLKKIMPEDVRYIMLCSTLKTRETEKSNITDVQLVTMSNMGEKQGKTLLKLALDPTSSSEEDFKDLLDDE